MDSFAQSEQQNDRSKRWFTARRIPWTDEVSIGHALISDALYLGLENTVQLYRRQLKTAE